MLSSCVRVLRNKGVARVSMPATAQAAWWRWPVMGKSASACANKPKW
jgi:hypothetical protein